MFNTEEENIFLCCDSLFDFTSSIERKDSKCEVNNKEIKNKSNKIIFYIYHSKYKHHNNESKNWKHTYNHNDNIPNTENNNNVNDNLKNINWKIKDNLQLTENIILYRKDAYYKHFKAILGRFIKNKINKLKNKCFPYYSKNNFASPNYKYIGNPKEKDNFYFLSFKIKDILIYGKDAIKHNRQYNNELLINFIENNEIRTYDKLAYIELIKFLNDNVENAIIDFYNNKNELEKINKDPKYIIFDKHYKRETGISLLNKYGFLDALKKYNRNS